MHILILNTKKTNNQSAATDKEESENDKVSYILNPNISELNSDDVKILNSIIEDQKSRGATVNGDVTTDEYKWDVDGRLSAIYWNNKQLSGDISFAGLSELRIVDCGNEELVINTKTKESVTYSKDTYNQIKSIDVTNNT